MEKFSQDKPIINRRGLKRTLRISRSGTDSLCRALYKLGLPAYHGYNPVQNHWECILWREAIDAKWANKGKAWTPEDFDQIIGDYSAATDYPCAAFAAELIEAYPEAKVILNTRPYQDWEKSYRKAIQEPLLENIILKFLMWPDWEGRMEYKLWIPFFRNVCGGDFRRNSWRMYHDHNALVRGAATAPGRDPSMYLEWSPKDGWEPLCKFLGKPVPSEPFPCGNSAKELLDRIVRQAHGPRIARSIQMYSAATVVIVALAGIGVARWMRPGLFSKIF